MATATFPEPAPGSRLPRLAELVRITAFRSLKIRYRGTALGILWSFANPVLLTAVYTAIFGTAFRQYYGGSVVRYVLSAFVGLVVVTFFLNATGESLTTIVANGLLLNKIPVPPVIFPVASVVSNVFQQLVTTFWIVFAVSIVFTRDPVRVALVPVVLLAVILLVAGFSLALSALYVFFRDLPHLWGIVGFILWMTSPLFYPIEIVPANVRPYYDLNPIGVSISALREVTLRRGPLHLHEIALALAAGLVALALGAAFFQATRREFMDLL
ncbi:MAG TPA: ABC transporter permease [Candidatus Elarobacter sp.]|jgi:ABC-type polysaccharide/polyol phosphate export permease|nr:ABC transporter permease [Candidatus Elarobacter sp.]